LKQSNYGQTLKEGKIRESNFELLRIVCMFLIIVYHCIVHGFPTLENPFLYKVNLNYIFAVILGSWGKLGVFGFVFITSFFMCDKNKIKSQNIVEIYLKALIFSAILGGIGFYIKELSLKMLITEFLKPINQYWFLETYILFFLMLPVLYVVQNKLTDNSLKKLVIILTVAVPIYDLFFYTSQGGNLADFIYCYFLMSYLKNKPNNFFEKNRKIIFIVITLAVIILRVGISYTGDITGIYYIKSLQYRLADPNIIAVIQALALFYIFKNIKCADNKYINLVAKSTLGIYILHENIFIRHDKQSLLYNRILKIPYFYTTAYFPIVLLIFGLDIFIICSIIDILFSKFIITPIMNLKIIQKLCNKFDNWYVIEEK
jgi:hypothetical protein